MKLYKFTTMFIPEKDRSGAYWVKVPALSEVTTGGNSLEEARFMAQDALELVVLSRLEEGGSVPEDKKPAHVPRGAVVEEILVTVSHNVQSAPLTAHVKAAFA